MSLTVAKAEGFTVLTVISDPESPCPPLCQIIKGLCYSPGCCSLSERWRGVHRTSQSVLATLHIVFGLFNIGLGVVFDERSSPYPFWLGTMYLLFGVVNILSNKFPSLCLAVLNVILNLAGICFAIAGIILYSLDLAFVTLWWLCDDDYDSQTPSPAHYDQWEKCWNAKSMALTTMRGIMVVLIIVSVLELCVTIISAVLGIKDLKNKKEYKSLEKKDATTDPAA
ncbi:transmembrane protein 176A-like [Antennarius striatus]|uniref:transmembrane protein 176A-like n=1 Tax=Antennarius striatus TaxID=241820 RepID=UPI0035B3CA38